MSYILNGTTLPTPKTFKREVIDVSSNAKGVNGKHGRDTRLRKEKFIIGWDSLESSEIDTILAILDLNTGVTFQVTETNLTIAETNVFVTLDTIDYSTPGEDYRSETNIQLIEVN